MAYALTVVYDDRQLPSPEIESIIGAARFSSILRRRRSLGQEVAGIMERAGATDFFHLADDRDGLFLLELVEASSQDRIFLRFPSCLMPSRPDALQAVVAQAAFAPGTTLLAPPTGGEVAALLTAADLRPLLARYDDSAVREFHAGLARSRAIMSDDPCGFMDLRRADSFLSFMSGATETRAFNSNQMERRSLRKSSTDRAKMEAEYNFFHVAPESLKPFLLPTYDFRDDGQRASYAMERLAIPDVALQFIHHAFDTASFAVLLERFFDFIEARPLREIGVDAVRANARDTILGKMDRRLAQFLSMEVGRRLDAILSASGPGGGWRRWPPAPGI
ncbi:hypothetical protein [Nitrospirillum sp. BR 11828]|uniref:hypothetical protein n=1 Tax=Nitrospirillum sp. BR 11828 TaxID=3104325 RepID=UPI002AC9FF42|nr:hypothetical protein [Nitrospirillum sp. BR 11828]MDZ5650607.1 hypothetical protein [Nitrospirillum sp. BR 11828]